MRLIDMLRNEGSGPADGSYGRGHERATGAALRADGRNGLIARLGFGPDTQACA